MTASVVVEEAVIHAGVHVEPAVGVPAIGLVVAALAVAAVSPAAAFTVSIVYGRLGQAPEDARAGLPGDTGAPPSTRRTAAAGSG